MKLLKLLFPINRNNVFKGLMYAMILSATLHLLACFYMAMRTNNTDYINMFNILGISLIFPSLGSGEGNSLIGIIAVILVGTWFYAMQQMHDRRIKRQVK